LKEINHMLKLISVFISLFLISIIFLRIPQENTGLASFATKSNILGSPSSAQRFLNILTAIGIIVYLIIAIQINILNN
jgi:preprotein translocase subunit SecG